MKQILKKRDSIVQILWIARWDYSAKSVVRKHEHSHYQLTYFLEGGCQSSTDDQEQRLSTGMVYFCQPDRSHGFVTVSDGVTKTIEIKFNVLSRTMRNKLEDVKNVFDLPSLEPLVKKLYNEALMQEQMYREFSDIYLHLMLTYLLRSHVIEAEEKETVLVNSTHKNCLIDRFQLFIQNNYRRDIKLNDIAEGIGYNPNYLSQCVKRTYNCGPIEFLYRYRLRVAKDLLIFSETDIKQIADEVGFKTISHFSAKYKKTFGTSPSQYRQLVRGKSQSDLLFDPSFTYFNYIEECGSPSK